LCVIFETAVKIFRNGQKKLGLETYFFTAGIII